MAVKFSAYPWERVARRTRREAATETAAARWIGVVRPDKLAALAGPARAEIVRVGEPGAMDPHAASCELRAFGMSVDVRGAAALVRAIAQRVLGGPEELAAPRPLGAVEHAVWALAVAAAVEDLGIPGEVWPRIAAGSVGDSLAIELAVELGGVRGTVVALAPRELELRAPARPLGAAADAWSLDAEVVVARCALERAAIAALRRDDLVTVEPVCELAVAGGAYALRAVPGALVAEALGGYVRRDMPDEPSVELTVALGTTRLTLRQVLELGVGQIVQLGRPLAGPFEIRAMGRVLGQGELVDVDGELAVRILSLEAAK